MIPIARRERPIARRRAQPVARADHFAHGLATDHFGVMVDREWPPDEIALHFVAILLREERELILGFDALGEHRQFQPAGETDHGADDRRGLRVGSQFRYEGLVDLDLVERKRLQIRQGGISRAEIVHRDAHSERLEPPQDRDRAREILHQDPLGDLEFQPARRQPGFQ